MSYPLHRLKEDERQVYLAIFQNVRIKMRDVAKRTNIGSKKKYERDKKNGSTERKVRDVVHRLRLDHKIPVISDEMGYFIGRTEEEARKYMAMLAAVLKTHLVTYHTLKKIFGVSDKGAEDQMRMALKYE